MGGPLNNSAKYQIMGGATLKANSNSKASSSLLLAHCGSHQCDRCLVDGPENRGCQMILVACKGSDVRCQMILVASKGKGW